MNRWVLREIVSLRIEKREKGKQEIVAPSRNQLMREGKEVRYLPMRRKKRLDGRSYTARMRMRERRVSPIEFYRLLILFLSLFHSNQEGV